MKKNGIKGFDHDLVGAVDSVQQLRTDFCAVRTVAFPTDLLLTLLFHLRHILPASPLVMTPDSAVAVLSGMGFAPARLKNGRDHAAWITLIFAHRPHSSWGIELVKHWCVFP